MSHTGTHKQPLHLEMPRTASLRAWLFHLTLSIDYSGWKTLLCTAPSLSIPWLQHCIPAVLPSSPVQSWPGCEPPAVSPCHCCHARHRHCHHEPWEGKDPSPALSGHAFPLPPLQLLAQQLLIQLSSQSVTSSLVPVQMFYKSASGEQWADEMLRSDSTVRSNWFLLTSRTNYEIIFPVCCS